MSHLDEGRLQELLDGEIPSIELPPIQAHLKECAECRARLAEAREWAGEADRLVESVELPEPGPARVMPATATGRRPPWGRSLAWAATLVLAAGLGYLARQPVLRPAPRQEAARPSPIAPAAPAKNETGTVDSPPAFAPAKPVVLGDGADRERASDRAVRSAPALRALQDAAPPPVNSVRPAAPAAGVAGASADAPVQGKAAGKANTMVSTPLRLDETVTTGVAERSAAPLPLGAGALQRRDSIVELTLTDAVRRMGGTLRLIEGLVPLRLESLGDEVRVVYPVSQGELVLAQKLVDGLVHFRLIAPPGFPADSLTLLRARVRE